MKDSSLNNTERTRVYLTVDVECAEERANANAAPMPPQDYDLRVWGRLKNQKQELGIPLIMDELESRGMRGTFYTEVMGSHYFGMKGLRESCLAMTGRGHDVQLHLHPVQKQPLLTDGEPSEPDNIGDYSLSAQVALLKEGIGLMTQAGVPAKQLCSFRAGNFGANNTTWQAMSQAGLSISSNYNPCYFDKDCAIRSDLARPGLFATDAKGVWELPISNFNDPAGRFRHLQITAVSLSEMIDCLKQSRRLGIRDIVLVTHSFEFFHLDSIDARRGHKNRVNIARLRGILQFVHDNSNEFAMTTVSDLANSLPDCTDGDGATTYPVESKARYYNRLFEQGLKRLESRVPI